MATAGPSAPGTGETTDNSGGANNLPWTNPGNVTASDDTYATIAVTGSTSWDLVGRNFGFSIPTGATIDGVEVTVDRKASANSKFDFANDFQGYLRSAGARIGTNQVTPAKQPTSEATITIGGPTSLWGATLTPDIVNSSSFGFGFAVNGSNVISSVDTMTMKIYYTEGGGSSIVAISTQYRKRRYG